MRCTSPRTVGFLSDGKTLCWSQKHYSKEFPTFQLPCSKCLSCRLEYARQWAIRCIHEAMMHEESCFLTLTYDDQHLKSEKLIYKDFQDFMKRLREKYPHKQISYFVTGEYGDKNKRPHWHACIFGHIPEDSKYKYSNDRGDKIFQAETLKSLWPMGISEYGTITFESAGYCARYSAKKLHHGPDGHQYEPISKKSSKHAIGKRWLEKYWQDAFTHGRIILPDGKSCSIPRYYEKWLLKHNPSAWRRYVTEIKHKITLEAETKELQTKKEEKLINLKRSGLKGLQISRTKVANKILEEKFKQLKTKL